MKSRLVILTMLVLGMLLSTAGAGLAVSGISGDAALEQYGASETPSGGGDVLGDQDAGTNAPANNGGGGGTNPGGGEGDTQPARQVEAGTDTDSSLPFTGFAAIPVLLGGIALLSAGLVLRRRTGDER